MSTQQFRLRGEQGVALVLSLSVLTVITIMAVGFAFSMRLEERSAWNFQLGFRARNMAEFGVVHARTLLEQDGRLDDTPLPIPISYELGRGYDGLDEGWSTTFVGDEADVDGDGVPESRWFMTDWEEDVGRYAVLVEDESASLNVNEPEGLRLEAALASALAAAGDTEALQHAATLVAWRYGPDGLPGQANEDDDGDNRVLEHDNYDNDGDGVIDELGEGVDEPDEFVWPQPFGDDRVYLTLDQVQAVGELSDEVWDVAAASLTVDSVEPNVDAWGQPRLNVNAATAGQLLDVLKQAGIDNPWQLAANMVDFSDQDFAQSVTLRTSNQLAIPQATVITEGDWLRRSSGYELGNPAGEPGVWVWNSVPYGEYLIRIHALQPGALVGDVTINGLTHRSLQGGTLFGAPWQGSVFAGSAGASGSLEVTVAHTGQEGVVCSIASFELIPVTGGSGWTTTPMYGVEGIRINEMMVRPENQYAVTTGQSPGGDWVWTGTVYQNLVGQGAALGEGTWDWQGLPDGQYYLTVLGVEGQPVGDVRVGGSTQAGMQHETRYTSTASVRVIGGRLRLSIQNNEPEETTCAFSGIILSQQPDTEYIELLNLTPFEVDLGGWTVEGTGLDGWPARIPIGTYIAPGGTVVLAADVSDATQGISGNGIAFYQAWQAGDINAVGLDFTRPVSPDSDLLRDAPLPDVTTVSLRDAYGNVVDRVRYSSSGVSSFVSLERGDPLVTGSLDVNGVPDPWHLSEDEAGGTPGALNANAGMREVITVDGEPVIIEHSQSERFVANSALPNVGALRHVVWGEEPWEALEAADLAPLVDRLTTRGIRLDVERAAAGGAWQMSDRPRPSTPWAVSTVADEEGSWSWGEQDRVHNGVYRLTLFGLPGEALSVSLRLADGTWTPWTPPLWSGASGEVVYGQVEIGTGSTLATLPHTLEVRVRNQSPTGVAHLDYVRLDPQLEVVGRVNINTADLTVLETVTGLSSESASALMWGRPFGNAGGYRRGLGDLLVADVLSGDGTEGPLKVFEQVADRLTVRSKVYRITVLGQVLRGGRVMAEKWIQTVVER